MLARQLARRGGAAGGDRLADRAVLEVVLRVELVQLDTGAPDLVADERAARTLREPLHERHLRHPVDDVVERVVGLHPVHEERRVAHLAARAPARAARASERRTPARPRSSAARSAGRHARRRDLGRERLQLGPDEERLPQLAGEIERTRTPRFGSNDTSPRAASRRSASRTGVRLTSNRSESCSCRSTVPGGIAPPTISSSSTRAMSSALVEASCTSHESRAPTASDRTYLGSEMRHIEHLARIKSAI